MLSLDMNSFYKSYGYRFIKGPQHPPAQLYSIGWQIQTSTDYNWDGMKRADEAGNCAFQYTLSGSGILEFEGEKHVLEEGTAFFISLPGKHRYYLPENSEKWEFIFITLTGEYTISEWKKFQQLQGWVLRYDEQSEIIQYLWEIYWKASKDQITDGYQTSAIAYEFIMKLYRSLNSQTRNDSPYSASIDKSLQFMKDNLQKELTLDDIALASGMSRFHFNHSFSKVIGISPWNYLTKLRIEKAVKLLVSTKLTVDEISGAVGYSSSNYFNKVFRKYMGTSPGRLREIYSNINNFTVNL